jgi:CHAT domain-containing protein
MAAGETAEAEKSLGDGTAVQEAQWGHVIRHLDDRRDGEPWTAYYARGRELFDQTIRLQAMADRPARSFATAERSLAWELLLQLLAMPSLPPGMGNRASVHRNPSGLARLRQEMDAGTVVVEYRVLEDQLLCWTVRREGIKLTVTPVRRTELTALTAHLPMQAQESSLRRDVLDTMGALRTILLAPIEGELAGADEILFVPDRPLSGVPFAALWHRRSARFLVEDYAVAVAPSADAYLSALNRDRKLAAAGAPRSALVVRDPAFRRDLFGPLASLTAAAREGAAAASAYPAAELLTGETAAKNLVLGAMGRHPVVHIAGHALSFAANPLASVLPLAPSGPGDSGALYAYELLGRVFPQTRLVVLAACATAGEPGADRDIVSGFVRPLLGDGVPTVVASLWRVDDQASADFFEAFHRHYGAGEDAPHALRAAQIAALHSDREATPLLWAAFEVFGGSACAERRCRWRRST